MVWEVHQLGGFCGLFLRLPGLANRIGGMFNRMSDLLFSIILRVEQTVKTWKAESLVFGDWLSAIVEVGIRLSTPKEFMRIWLSRTFSFTAKIHGE